MFGDRFSQILKILSISQAELAKSLNLSPAAIHKIRTNKTNPSASTILALVNKYNFSYDWIMEGKGNIFKSSAKKTGIIPTQESYTLMIQDLIKINKGLAEANAKLASTNATLSDKLKHKNS